MGMTKADWKREFIYYLNWLNDESFYLGCLRKRAEHVQADLVAERCANIYAHVCTIANVLGVEVDTVAVNEHDTDYMKTIIVRK